MAVIIKYKKSLGIDIKSYKPHEEIDNTVSCSSFCKKPITKTLLQSQVTSSISKRDIGSVLFNEVPSMVGKRYKANTAQYNKHVTSSASTVKPKVKEQTNSQHNAADQILSMTETFQSIASSAQRSQQLLQKKCNVRVYKRNMVLSLVNDAKRKRITSEWICQICGKVFYKKQHHEKHVSVHVQPKDLRCPVADCRRPFNVNEDLARHMKIHKPQDERVWFYCSTCGSRFGYGGDVVRHMKNSSNNCKLQQYRKVFPNGTVIYTGKLPQVKPFQND